MVGSQTPINRTVTGGIECSQITGLGTGTIETVSGTNNTRLVIAGGTFDSQTYIDDNGATRNYKFGPDTYIIIGAVGPVMTTEIHKVKSITGNNYVNLERPTTGAIVAGTPFYFTDPSLMNGVNSTLLMNMSAVSGGWTDQYGTSNVLLGFAAYAQNDATNSSVVTPIMVDASATTIQISNTRTH